MQYSPQFLHVATGVSSVGLAIKWSGNSRRFYTPRVFTHPRVRSRGTGVRRRKSPARGLFAGGRDLFLRAVYQITTTPFQKHQFNACWAAFDTTGFAFFTDGGFYIKHVSFS